MVDVPRLILLLMLLSITALAVANDCPVTPEDPYTVVSGWPTTGRDPGSTWTTTHVTASAAVVCGTTINAATTISNIGPTTVAAAIAHIDGILGALPGYSLMTTCGRQVSGTTWAVTRVYSNGSTRRAGDARTVTTTSDCTPPPEPDDDQCQFLADKDAQGFANNRDIDTYEPPETQCIEGVGGDGGDCESYRRGFLNDSGRTHCIPGTDLGCQPLEYSRSDNGDGTANFMWRNTFTGLTCDVPEGDMEEVVVTGEGCNDAWCQGTGSRPDCGFFDGKYICVEDFSDDNECYRWADGQMVCADNAPTPPKPDNGTPGEPATPDDQIDVCTGADSCQTINNYDSTTTGGSSRPPGGETGGPGSGSGTGSGTGSGSGDGTGDGEGEGDEEGSVSGGVLCDAPPVCDGDAIQCAIVEQEWRQRCAVDDPEDPGWTESEEDGTGFRENASDLGVGEISETGSLGAGGSCPAPFNVTVWGTTVEIDVWEYGCQAATLFAPIVMTLAYLLGGLMLVRGL